MTMNAKNCMKFVHGKYNEKNVKKLEEEIGAVECKVYIAPDGYVYFLTKDEPAVNRIEPIIDEDYFIF